MQYNAWHGMLFFIEMQTNGFAHGILLAPHSWYMREWDPWVRDMIATSTISASYWSLLTNHDDFLSFSKFTRQSKSFYVSCASFKLLWAFALMEDTIWDNVYRLSIELKIVSLTLQKCLNRNPRFTQNLGGSPRRGMTMKAWSIVQNRDMHAIIHEI